MALGANGLGKDTREIAAARKHVDHQLAGFDPHKRDHLGRFAIGIAGNVRGRAVGIVECHPA